MTILIENLSFKAIIGILDFEREQKQQVIVDAKIDYEYNGDIFLDYAKIATLIEDDLQNKKYDLLENALLGIKDAITKSYPFITSIFVKITKPDIIKNCTVGVSNLWNF